MDMIAFCYCYISFVTDGHIDLICLPFEQEGLGRFESAAHSENKPQKCGRLRVRPSRMRKAGDGADHATRAKSHKSGLSHGSPADRTLLHGGYNCWRRHCARVQFHQFSFLFGEIGGGAPKKIKS
jgi:hypothetical protein